MPTVRQRDRRASDLGRRRDNGRRKRRPTAPEAHAEMKTREIRNRAMPSWRQRREGRSKA